MTFAGRRRNIKVKAVVDVSFAVKPGETFGVIGESGSGKSTLGRAIVCLLRPSSGQILHSGVDPFRLSSAELRQHRRSFQIVFQDPNAALDPRMTILESVCEPLDVAGIGTAAERRRRALEILDRVALSEELVDRYPHEISGGQKQRANIARALVLEPRLIVCDEVVAALDVSIQADMLNLFADLQREFGLTYLFISHDLRVVAHISDRVAVMYAGKLAELAPADQLMDAPLHPYTQALLSAEPEPKVPEAGTSRRIILKGEIRAHWQQPPDLTPLRTIAARSHARSAPPANRNGGSYRPAVLSHATSPASHCPRVGASHSAVQPRFEIVIPRFLICACPLRKTGVHFSQDCAKVRPAKRRQRKKQRRPSRRGGFHD